jgi:hypothetical protein
MQTRIRPLGWSTWIVVLIVLLLVLVAGLVYLVG